ncbi:MAG: hypothetical protein K940chlam2_01416 [Chlamydiae bacterium]|nr:hypothetical protein [Chlamydiota bacterium]
MSEDETIRKVLPAQPGWFLVFPFTDKEGRVTGVDLEPIVAWIVEYCLDYDRDHHGVVWGDWARPVTTCIEGGYRDDLPVLGPDGIYRTQEGPSFKNEPELLGYLQTKIKDK